MVPTASSSSTTVTNPYVGIANARPDSLTPRRFISASRVTRAMFSGTVAGAIRGNADTMFATPAATETATVST